MRMVESSQANARGVPRPTNVVGEVLRDLERSRFCDCPHHDAHLASKSTWLWGVLAELHRLSVSYRTEGKQSWQISYRQA